MSYRSRVKGWIRRGLRRAGWDVHRFGPTTDPAVQCAVALRHHETDLVIDVGANVGQFASELRNVGYKGQIVSFEPLSSAHRVLSKRARRDPLWTVHERCAVGDEDGETVIHVSANSVSSSILPMLDAHTSAAQSSAYVSEESTPVVRLDTVLPQYLERSRNAFIKIDTQGFEKQVLDGACTSLQRVQGVLCELSLVPLYEGQTLWQDMIARLESDGFHLWFLQPGFIDPKTGQSLQLDGAFFREKG